MKIVVAGAGHGGLVAAAKLAKAGYDVTVLEKKQHEDMGYDWEDRFSFDLLMRLTESDCLPDGSYSPRGDCDFVSPSYRKRVTIKYTDETRQSVMWRKPIMDMLTEYAVDCGARLEYGVEVLAPVVSGSKVVGVKTTDADYAADLVIDSAGFFSPVRSNLPLSLGIENKAERGDAFYAYRAYFNNTREGYVPDIPFEIYLCHNKEQGLSWVNTTEKWVDVLIGRIDPLSKEKVYEQIDSFRANHDWIGKDILHGGKLCVIPVRRPLALMVAEGYAAVGDSAFMTTPMNGMGLDLSMLAGELLAKTIISNNGDASLQSLWQYNRDFHRLYGGETAKNEGLKNSLLSLPGEGVDFLFEHEIIQASDLAGAGKNTSMSALMGKFVRGMKAPKYFFAIINGLMKGAKVCSMYKKAPEAYDKGKILEWQKKIKDNALRVTR